MYSKQLKIVPSITFRMYTILMHNWQVVPKNLTIIWLRPLFVDINDWTDGLVGTTLSGDKWDNPLFAPTRVPY